MTSAVSSLRRRLWSECSRLARSNSNSNGSVRRFSSESASTSSPPPPLSASSSSEVPGLALWLGATGAVPFLALAPQVEPHIPLLPPFVRENAAALQVGYGVAIASFLGGIHWGLAATGAAWGARTTAATAAKATAAAATASRAAASSSATAARYLWSVTPCLLAWPATALIAGGRKSESKARAEKEEDEDEAKAAGLAAATLAVAVAADASFASRGLLPPYLMKLRVPLSAAAVGGLALRAADAKRRSGERRGSEEKSVK